MLYLTPNNYIEISNIKFIINLNISSNFNKHLKKRIGEHNFEINETSRRKKRSLIILENKQVTLCNLNTNTLHERIKLNEVKSLKFLDISYKNYIPIKNILLITEYQTQPIIDIVRELREKKSIKLYNFTGPRTTKSVIFTIHNEVILSAIETKTLCKKANKEDLTFQSVGVNSFINIFHINMIANREKNHIKNKVKAISDIENNYSQSSSKRILKVCKSDKPKSAIFCTNNFIVLSKNNPDTIRNGITNLENINYDETEEPEEENNMQDDIIDTDNE